MLRQIEWRVQNGPMSKNGVLPVTTFFFFGNFVSVQRFDLIYQLLKYPNSYFLQTLEFSLRVLFPVSILNSLNAKVAII